uniref:DUF4190 domain-containing protein n=1 Tax=uncultured bacterium contig00025 TaxID=1181514 RepID=A0A806KFN1_9BACT|nr:hypothetical protein [uncultured bacterium contig00025]
MLDEDMRFCPYCNSEDPDWDESGNIFGKLAQVNDLVGERKEPSNGGAASRPEQYPILPQPANPIYIQPSPVRDAAEDNRPSGGLYAGMILLSVFLSFPGIIVGIVYATKKNRHYQTLGIIMLIIGVFGLLLSGTACLGLLLFLSY